MNFPIVASIVEKVTGERFDIWMRREVLQPMKLDACFNWPTCSDAAVARAVELDDPSGKPLKDDLHGVRPACPVQVDEGEPCDLSRWRPGENGALFAPQGGLRISARGLARVGRMLLNGGDARRRAHPVAAIGRNIACAGMALRRPQRRPRRRKCGHLRLRPRDAADPDARRAVPMTWVRKAASSSATPAMPTASRAAYGSTVRAASESPIS